MIVILVKGGGWGWEVIGMQCHAVTCNNLGSAGMFSDATFEAFFCSRAI